MTVHSKRVILLLVGIFTPTMVYSWVFYKWFIEPFERHNQLMLQGDPGPALALCFGFLPLVCITLFAIWLPLFGFLDDRIARRRGRED